MLKSKFSLSRHFEYANEQITYHFWLCLFLRNSRRKSGVGKMNGTVITNRLQNSFKIKDNNVYGSLYYWNFRTSSFKQVACLILGSECIASYRKKFHLPYDHDHYVYWHWVFFRAKAYVKFYIYFIKVWQTRMQFYMIRFNLVWKKTKWTIFHRPKKFFLNTSVIFYFTH
jgi:hypothetical protein